MTTTSTENTIDDGLSRHYFLAMLGIKAGQFAQIDLTVAAHELWPAFLRWVPMLMLYFCDQVEAVSTGPLLL
jgi:hypothetical protein